MDPRFRGDDDNRGSLSLRDELNPMDPRFRGDDDNRGKSEGLLPMTQITRETRIALTEINRVIPGPRSGTRNPWGSSLGHELNPMGFVAWARTQPHGSPLSRG